jgi:DNA-binding response OmpR family regulator
MDDSMARVLIVDSEESILFALKEYFSCLGIEVDCARDAEEALALLTGVRYAVIITELSLTPLKGAQGLEIVAEARQRSAWTGIIVLTAYCTHEHEVDAVRSGADYIIQKPLRLGQIGRIVFGLIELSKAGMS